MAIADPNPVRTSPLVARAKAILVSPGPEWIRIDDEPTTLQRLYLGYACVLAAIPAIAMFIGEFALGSSTWGDGLRPSIASLLAAAIAEYALSLGAVAVLALLIDSLAASFGGQKNQVQAFKLAIYSATAAWVTGIFHLLPILGGLAILGGVYSLFLLYLGLPRLMKVPRDRALAYAVVVLLIAVVLFAIVGAVTGGMVRWV